MKIVDASMGQTFAMGETVELILQGKKHTQYFFVVGGKNGEINAALEHRFAIGHASLVDYRKNGYSDKRVVVTDPDDDGITESVMTNAFEPQQTIVMLEGIPHDSAKQYMSQLHKEYGNRVKLAYRDVQDDFHIEARIINENNGILRVKNPIHFDFYGSYDVADIIPFKTGYLKRDRMIVSKDLTDLSEIELELIGNYNLEPENVKPPANNNRRHLRIIK